MPTLKKYLDKFKEYDIEATDLRDEAQTAVASHENVSVEIAAIEAENKPVPKELTDYANELDNWICADIMDYIDDKDDNQKPVPVKPTIKPVENFSPEGELIETELEGLQKSGKKQFLLEEIKQLAPKSYNVIFTTYKSGEANGIETTNYSLLETNAETKEFTIKRK